MVPKVDDENYPRLSGRVRAAIELQKESRSVEFKQSASWDSLQSKLVKSALAMSNLRDGGMVVIGLAEVDDGYSVEGIEEAHLATFDVDKCVAFINKYCTPKIDIDIVRVEFFEKEFLVFQFPGLSELPVVCAREHSGWGLYRGDILIRPKGMARSERVSGEEQTLEIIKLAAFAMARRLIQESEEIGATIGRKNSLEMYEKERDGL